MQFNYMYKTLIWVTCHLKMKFNEILLQQRFV